MLEATPEDFSAVRSEVLAEVDEAIKEKSQDAAGAEELQLISQWLWRRYNLASAWHIHCGFESVEEPRWRPVSHLRKLCSEVREAMAVGNRHLVGDPLLPIELPDDFVAKLAQLPDDEFKSLLSRNEKDLNYWWRDSDALALLRVR
jgi:hypothetical protein